jgi:hypothetical protein
MPQTDQEQISDSGYPSNRDGLPDTHSHENKTEQARSCIQDQIAVHSCTFAVPQCLSATSSRMNEGSELMASRRRGETKSPRISLELTKEPQSQPSKPRTGTGLEGSSLRIFTAGQCHLDREVVG